METALPTNWSAQEQLVHEVWQMWATTSGYGIFCSSSARYIITSWVTDWRSPYGLTGEIRVQKTSGCGNFKPIRVHVNACWRSRPISIRSTTFCHQYQGVKGHSMNYRLVGVIIHGRPNRLRLMTMTEKHKTGANHIIETMHRVITEMYIIY